MVYLGVTQPFLIWISPVTRAEENRNYCAMVLLSEPWDYKGGDLEFFGGWGDKETAGKSSHESYSSTNQFLLKGCPGLGNHHFWREQPPYKYTAVGYGVNMDPCWWFGLVWLKPWAVVEGHTPYQATNLSHQLEES